MFDLNLIGWIVIALCAALVGISKTGIPGVGILVVPLMASVLPARSSTGVLLGILILADLFAAGYYRHNANWWHVLRVVPAAFVGITAGYFALKEVSDQQLKPIIGIIVLAMLAVNYWRTKITAEDAPVLTRCPDLRRETQGPAQWWFAVGLGFLAGVTTMMANAAGPVMTVYLLAMRLGKIEFVGTSAWFFFIINWLKVPFSARLQLMSAESLKVDFVMLPFIALGAAAGILVLKKIPQKAFNVVVQILAAAAAVKLLF